MKQDILKYLNNYSDNIKLQLKNYHNETLEGVSSLVKKIAQDKKRFTEDEKFIFNELFETKEFQTHIKKPKEKKHFITTNLFEDKTSNANNEAKFKHKGQLYYTNIDMAKVNDNVINDITRHISGQDKTAYFMFKELADKINKEEEYTIHEEPLFYDSKEPSITRSGFVDREAKEQYGSDVFYHGYESGGAEGGSYTGTTAVDYTNPIPASYSAYDFPQVTKILEHIDPEITFLQYKKLEKEIANKSKQVEIIDSSDYYGNYIEYTCSILLYQDLYTAMKDVGIDVDNKLETINQPSNQKSSKPKM